MIRDPEAFLNPEGRSDPRGDGIFPGLTGLAVWGGSSLIERTLLKGMYTKKNYLEVAAELKQSNQYGLMKTRAKVLRAHPYMKSFPSIPSHLDYVRAKRVSTGIRKKASTLKDVSTARAKISKMKDYNAFAKSSSKFFKGIASATAISFAFSLGEKLFTPSVNKLAADKDAAVFYDESIMDSGAAYTQRQRAIMAIMDNNIAINNVIGNEASHFHR